MSLVVASLFVIALQTAPVRLGHRLLCEAPPKPKIPTERDMVCPAGSKLFSHIDTDGKAAWCRLGDRLLSRPFWRASDESGALELADGTSLHWKGDGTLLAYDLPLRRMEVRYHPDGALRDVRVYDAADRLRCVEERESDGGVAYSLREQPDGGTKELTLKRVATDGGTSSIEKETFKAIIRRQQNEVKFCYERELQEKPNLAGTITVSWLVTELGRVTEAEVTEDTMKDAAVVRCILRRVQRWRFPESSQTTAISFPWVFVAVDGGEE